MTSRSSFHKSSKRSNFTCVRKRKTIQLTHMTSEGSAGSPLQEQSLEREQRFQELFQHSPDAIFIENFEGYVLDVNDAACRLHRLEREQLIGKHFTELVPVHDRDNARALFRKMVAGETDRLEGYSWTEPREAVPVEIRARHIRYDQQPALLLSVRDISELKQTEAELQRARNQLREAIEAVSEGFALYDAEDRLVLCNQRYREVYKESAPVLREGCTFEEIVRYGAEHGQYPEALGRVDEWVQTRVKQHQNPTGEIIEQPLPDGRWVRIQEQRTKEGGVVGIRTDITELKQREQALQESEERWRALVENNPEGIAIVVEQQLVYLNPAGCRVFGAGSADELIGRNPLDFLAPEDLEVLLERLKRDPSEALALREYKIVRLDGKTRHVEVFPVPVTHQGQAATQIVLRDVTERKEAQETLVRYRDIIASSSDAIMGTDLNGRINSWNPAAETLFGYTAEEAVGLHITALLPHHLRDEPHPLLNAVRAGKRIEHVETVRLHKNGTPIHVSMTASPVRDSSGRTIGGTAVAHDITTRKRLEQDLQETQRKLAEIRESERQHLARELHDTVLQQLLGVSYQVAELERQVMKTLKGTPAEAGLVDAISTHRQEVLNGVNQLRHLIRGLRPPGLQELGLTATLEQYIQSLRRGDPAAPVITWEIRNSGALLPFPVSLSLFRSAQEALRNALRHARAARVEVQLDIEPDRVTLSVRDDGVGFVVPDRLSRLGHENHFGLVGVEEYVKIVGGSLQVASRPGEGTEVKVSVPL